MKRSALGSLPLFAALGDETRLRLIAVLCAGGAMSIAQLTSGTEITRQAVTKHLHVLADAGLVRDTKVGRERLWEFEPAQLEEARRSLDLIAQQWDQALSRLKAAVEALICGAGRSGAGCKCGWAIPGEVSAPGTRGMQSRRPPGYDAGMSDGHKKVNTAAWGAAALVALVLYVASSGPTRKLGAVIGPGGGSETWNDGTFVRPGDWWEVVYCPLDWLSVQPGGEIFRWYWSLFSMPEPALPPGVKVLIPSATPAK